MIHKYTLFGSSFLRKKWLKICEWCYFCDKLNAREIEKERGDSPLLSRQWMNVASHQSPYISTNEIKLIKQSETTKQKKRWVINFVLNTDKFSSFIYMQMKKDLFSYANHFNLYDLYQIINLSLIYAKKKRYCNQFIIW